VPVTDEEEETEREEDVEEDTEHKENEEDRDKKKDDKELQEEDPELLVPSLSYRPYQGRRQSSYSSIDSEGGERVVYLATRNVESKLLRMAGIAPGVDATHWALVIDNVYYQLDYSREKGMIYLSHKRFKKWRVYTKIGVTKLGHVDIKQRAEALIATMQGLGDYNVFINSCQEFARLLSKGISHTLHWPQAIKLRRELKAGVGHALEKAAPFVPNAMKELAAS